MYSYYMWYLLNNRIPLYRYFVSVWKQSTCFELRHLNYCILHIGWHFQLKKILTCRHIHVKMRWEDRDSSESQATNLPSKRIKSSVSRCVKNNILIDCCLFENKHRFWVIIRTCRNKELNDEDIDQYVGIRTTRKLIVSISRHCLF